jgi:hypothetical protein
LLNADQAVAFHSEQEPRRRPWFPSLVQPCGGALLG